MEDEARDVAGTSGRPHGPTSAEVRVVVRHDGERLIVSVHGEADAQTSGALRSALVATLTGTTASVVLDLERLTFCDLAGSDALHGFVAHAAWRGVPVTLRGMSRFTRWLYTEFPPEPASVLCPGPTGWSGVPPPGDGDATDRGVAGQWPAPGHPDAPSWPRRPRTRGRADRGSDS